ncbi:MAG: AMP-binding protein [Planctomycetota bacterium]|nr:AMP-binding protein [Planctomycetota bacterium]
MRIESFLEESARRRPGKTALVCGGRRLTYAELDASANRLARGLIERGIRRGDRVAVFLPNSVEAVVGIFAVLKSGAAFVMINPSTKSGKLSYVLNDSRAAAILLPRRKLAMVGQLDEEPPNMKLTICTGKGLAAETNGPNNSYVDYDRLVEERGGSADDTEKPAVESDADDLAAVIYTSGSTGRPKGVMHAHKNLAAATDSIAQYLENNEDDVILGVLSLSFGYGLTQLLTATKSSATLVLEESFTYPHAVMKRFEEERVTGFAMVPTIAAILLQMDLTKYDLRGLRYLTNAGAALPVPHVTALRNVLPHVRIFLMYGQTECIRTSFLPPEMIDTRPGSVGRGIPGVGAYVVDEAGRRALAGETGELVVRGANLMQGYWDLPEETKKSLRGDKETGEKLLYTGDLFKTDDDGYLYFVSRKDDMIKTRGEKVSPREVENVLHSHPDIAEAVVFGRPDDILGEAVHAAVVLRDARELPEHRLSQREVQRYCNSRLEDFMVPQVVSFRDSLPKTPNGKIDKQELLARADRYEQFVSRG